MTHMSYQEVARLLSDRRVIERFFARIQGNPSKNRFDQWDLAPMIRADLPQANLWIARHTTYGTWTPYRARTADALPVPVQEEIGFETLVIEPLGVSEGPQYEVAVRFVGVDPRIQMSHDQGRRFPGYAGTGALIPMGVDH